MERHREELGRYEIALVRTKYQGRNVIAAVDVETGEILIEKPDPERVLNGGQESPFSYLFAPGQNAARREVLFGREVLPDGRQCIYITDYETIPPTLLGCFWLGHRPRTKPKQDDGAEKKGTYHTGGKPGYARIYFAPLIQRVGKCELPDQTVGLLVKLLPYVEKGTGILIQPRRKKPLGFDDLAKVSGVKRTAFSERFKQLRQAGIIEDCPGGGGYAVSREFVAKG